MDKKALIAALAEYGKTIKENGWKAGEPVIEKYEKEFKDFRRWAHAAGIMLRAKELLETQDSQEKKQ